jgi:hypothetical protein
MASKSSTTLVRHLQSGCDVSHKITIYFLSTRCKKMAAYLRAYAVEGRSRKAEGTGGGFRLSGCETFSGNTFARLRLGAAVKQSALIRVLSTVPKADARAPAGALI